MNKIKIIIGLGNKDKEYEKTYHNAGFLFVDFWNEHQGEIAASLADELLAMTEKEKNPPARGLATSFKKGGIVTAIKTDGFMNQSGDSVAKILKERNLKIEDALIVHDDSDIYLGDYKISRDRGAAGHKGVEHIMAVFGTQDFARLRIGIRPKVLKESPTTILPLEYKREEGRKRMKAEEFVLKNISAANKKVLEKVFGEIAKKIKTP